MLPYNLVSPAIVRRCSEVGRCRPVRETLVISFASHHNCLVNEKTFTSSLESSETHGLGEGEELHWSWSLHISATPMTEVGQYEARSGKVVSVHWAS